jgi:hypothetical protein
MRRWRSAAVPGRWFLQTLAEVEGREMQRKGRHEAPEVQDVAARSATVTVEDVAADMD